MQKIFCDLGKQVLGVVNFPPKQIADFISEVLVLGVYAEQGVVLVQPEQPVKKGDKLGWFIILSLNDEIFVPFENNLWSEELDG